MIFIVDDDEAVRDSLRLLLECDGYAAMSFASADAFLAVARPTPTDCLIVDLYMPGTDGIALIEELRRRGIVLPSLVITGRPDVASRTRARAAGAVALLEKPYNIERLLALIRRMQPHAGRSPVPPDTDHFAG